MSGPPTPQTGTSRPGSTPPAATTPTLHRDIRRAAAAALAAVCTALLVPATPAAATDGDTSRASGAAGGSGGSATPAGGQITVVPGDQDGRGSPRVGIGVVDPGTVGTAGNGRPAASLGCRWVAAPDVEAALRRSLSPTGGSGSPPLLSSLFGQVCDGVTVGYAWLGPGVGAAAGGRVVRATPGQLAREAYAQLRLPAPSPDHSPDLRLADGRAAVLVGEQTWVWTDRSRFQTRSRRIRAGSVWAEVTAAPVALSFDPGDGAPAVSCAGPGTPFVAGHDPQHAASPTCNYQYRQSSADEPGGVVSAEWGVTWRVRWTGAAGAAAAGGQLPDMTSRTTTALAVAEGQALDVVEGRR
jgi:hypothetical protein